MRVPRARLQQDQDGSFTGLSLNYVAVADDADAAVAQVDVSAQGISSNARADSIDGQLRTVATQNGRTIGVATDAINHKIPTRTYAISVPITPNTEALGDRRQIDLTVELRGPTGELVDTVSGSDMLPPLSQTRPEPPENGNGGNGNGRGGQEGVSTEGLLIGAAGLGYLLLG